MQYFFEAFIKAVELIFSFDAELYGIIYLSLRVSIQAILVSIVLGIPLGVLIATKDFIGKRIVVNVINTLMSVPPVVVGLIVYILLSNQFGLVGNLRLLFTPTAMVIAQSFIAIPIVLGLTIVAVASVDPMLWRVSKSLGANGAQQAWVIVKEARYAIGAAIITAFGRLLSEVGAVMMVGGNIRFHTRVMTTAIALQKGMGEFQEAVALGMVLLILSFIINSALDGLRGSRRVG